VHPGLRQGSLPSVEALQLCVPLKVWYFFQPFRRAGWFVLLIGNVVNDVVVFLVLAFVVMVGFALAFFVMYRAVDSEEAAEYFQSLHYSILQLFAFLAGNFEIEVRPDSQSALPALSCRRSPRREGYPCSRRSPSSSTSPPRSSCC